jgi:hypothetical protein
MGDIGSLVMGAQVAGRSHEEGRQSKGGQVQLCGQVS